MDRQEAIQLAQDYGDGNFTFTTGNETEEVIYNFTVTTYGHDGDLPDLEYTYDMSNRIMGGVYFFVAVGFLLVPVIVLYQTRKGRG